MQSSWPACVSVCLSSVQEESKGINKEDPSTSGLSDPWVRLEIPLELLGHVGWLLLETHVEGGMLVWGCPFGCLLLVRDLVLRQPEGRGRGGSACSPHTLPVQQGKCPPTPGGRGWRGAGDPRPAGRDSPQQPVGSLPTWKEPMWWPLTAGQTRCDSSVSHSDLH